MADNLIDKIKLNISTMKRAFLGEFEEIVLLTVAGLGEQAYGVTITQTIEEKAGRAVGFSSVHTTLQRLAEKGYLTSHMGGATAERGGRRKRFFSLTAMGQQVILEVRRVREQLWTAIPSQTWQLMGG